MGQLKVWLVVRSVEPSRAKYQLLRVSGGQLTTPLSDDLIAIYKTRSDCRAFIDSCALDDGSTTDAACHNSYYAQEIAWLTVCVIPEATDISKIRYPLMFRWTSALERSIRRYDVQSGLHNGHLQY
jgi:hypothetical protein